MPDASPIAEGLTLLGVGGGVGAAVLKLAQIWLEKRGARPSRAKDASDIIAATAAFQLALNAAAEGIVGDLRATVERLEAEVDDLKRENVLCRSEGEVLKQADRERAQQFRSLTNLLRRKGIDLTSGDLEGSLIELEGDKGQVILPILKDRP